jgi:putative transposase
MVFGILKRVQAIVKRGLQAVSTVISHWTKPVMHHHALGTVVDLARSKPQLLAETLLLRQQLIVLNRSVKRPHFTCADRSLLVLLSSTLRNWKEALLIIKPETVLRWHRQGFRLFWKQKSFVRSCEPKVPAETITLIKEMAVNNRLWGAERIRGELSKVGINVAKRTVQRYMRQARPPRSARQTWASFIRNHANDIWACDFLQLHDVSFVRSSPSSSLSLAHGASCMSA